MFNQILLSDREKLALKRPIEKLRRSRRGPIKLQIEVPIFSDNEEDEEYLEGTPIQVRSNSRTPSIHLHINLESRSRSRKRDRSESVKSRSKRPLSSGYSSDNSSSLWSSRITTLASQTSDDPVFLMSNEESFSGVYSRKNSTRNSQIYDQVKKARDESWFREGNIYDKLSYSEKKRLSSVSSVSFNSLASKSAEIYEDISVYDNLQECLSSATYVNETSTKESSKKNRFKREYTVNEIFQNLKSFKEAAREVERMSDEPKSVRFLREKFEPRKVSSSSTRELIDENRERLKQLINKSIKIAKLTKINSSSAHHLYENEKICAPINV